MVLKDIEVPLIPSTIDCLSWSEDGEIAVGGSDQVRILIPNRARVKPSNDTPNVGPWLQVVLRINLFTDDEWADVDMARFTAMSLGEEQSNSHVTGLSWSPSGLGRNHRPCLAILTSNLLLSMWEQGPNPIAEESWERIIIINDVLQSYIQDNPYRQNTEPDPRELLQRRRRVRAFAWALPFKPSSHTAYWGPTSAVLAVANDCSEIFFLLIGRSFDMKQNLPVRHIHLMGHHFLDLPLKKERFRGVKDRLEWNAGSDNEQDIASTIQYTLNGYSGKLSVNFKSAGNQVQISKFLLGGISKALEISCELTIAEAESPRKAATYPNPLTLEPPTTHKYLSLHFEDMKYDYISEHEIDGDPDDQVYMKFWAFEHWKGYTAALVSLHPSQQLEYIPTLAEKCTITFTHTNLEAYQRSQDENPQERSEGYDPVEEELVLPWEHKKSDELRPMRLYMLEMLHKELAGRVRYVSSANSQLIYTMFFAALIWNIDRRETIYDLASYLLTYISRLSDLDSGGTDRGMSTVELLAKERYLLDQVRSEAGYSSSDIVQLVNECITTWELGDKEHALSPPFLETCQIPSCGRALLWSETSDARCVMGHVYDRCSFTLMAIQRPGISKHCDTCGRQFFHEESLFDADDMASEVSEDYNLDSTLAPAGISESHNDEAISSRSTSHAESNDNIIDQLAELFDGSADRADSTVDEPFDVVDNSVETTDGLVDKTENKRLTWTEPKLMRVFLFTTYRCLYCGGRFNG